MWRKEFKFKKLREIFNKFQEIINIKIREIIKLFKNYKISNEQMFNPNIFAHFRIKENNTTVIPVLDYHVLKYKTRRY